MYRQDRGRADRDRRDRGGAGQPVCQARGHQPRSQAGRPRSHRSAPTPRFRSPGGGRPADARIVAGSRTPEGLGSGGLRHDEHHAAVSRRLVGRGRRDARGIPLAFRPDRPAGHRLCRASLLPFRTQGGASWHDQHGCADLHRRAAGHRAEPARNAGRRRTRLFRRRDHAAVLPAGRPRTRRGDAQPDSRGRRRIAWPDGPQRERAARRWLDRTHGRRHSGARHGDAGGRGRGPRRRREN